MSDSFDLFWNLGQQKQIQANEAAIRQASEGLSDGQARLDQLNLENKRLKIVVAALTDLLLSKNLIQEEELKRHILEATRDYAERSPDTCPGCGREKRIFNKRCIYCNHYLGEFQRV